MEELHKCGADTFIRTGTCGGIDLNVQSGDVVVATGAIRYEHTSREYAPIEFPAVADFQVTNALVEATKKLGFPCTPASSSARTAFTASTTPLPRPCTTSCSRSGNPGSGWASRPVRWSPPPCSWWRRLWAAGAAPASMWCGTRNGEAAGLDQKMSEDTSSSVKVSVEALKLLIEADRKAGR